MRLLIITQKVDANDRNLGFFLHWIKAFAPHCRRIVVICLEEGEHSLPQNVSVFSLEKERGVSRIARFLRYQWLLWRHLGNIDGIFFHMCPEYVLAAHLLPKIFQVKTALWYVHKKISWRLWLAEKLINKIFTASRESCRLRGKKIEITGHGIDVELFTLRGNMPSDLRLITTGRISPVKNLCVLIRGFSELKQRVSKAEFSIVGEPVTREDRRHYDELLKESSLVRFLGSVSYFELPMFLREQTAFVHASKTGSIDKAVLEALAVGLPVFTSSEAFTEAIPGVRKFREGDPQDFAEKVLRAFESRELVINGEGRRYVCENHSLGRLIQKILAFYA